MTGNRAAPPDVEQGNPSIAEAIEIFRKDREVEVKEKFEYIVRISMTFALLGVGGWGLNLCVGLFNTTATPDVVYVAVNAVCVWSVIIGIVVMSTADFKFYDINAIFDQYPTLKYFIVTVLTVVGLGLTYAPPFVGGLFIFWSYWFSYQPTSLCCIENLPYLSRSRLLAILFSWVFITGVYTCVHVQERVCRLHLPQSYPHTYLHTYTSHPGYSPQSEHWVFTSIGHLLRATRSGFTDARTSSTKTSSTAGSSWVYGLLGGQLGWARM